MPAPSIIFMNRFVSLNVLSSLVILGVQNIFALESTSLESTPVRKTVLGDISVGYKILGSGKPIILIPGFSMTMDMWDQLMVEKLSANHTVILFDNRGMGYSNEGADNGNYSIRQLANDAAALIDSLKLREPIDVLGLSIGGFIAQELALLHPDKVNKLIIFASSCGGKYAIPPQVSSEVMKGMLNGNASQEQFISTLFPENWINENIEYINNNIDIPARKVSRESLIHQADANLNWEGTCDRLVKLKIPTLVLTGTNDITSPPENSLTVAQRIQGAWLIQISGGGHGLMFQWPEKVASIIDLFLKTA
jgi:pimeloyl-ACP methyl ester carboxylesterase